MAEQHALLAGRYRLVRQVGSGGMGVVWEALDERLERPVAVKQLRPQVGLSPEDAELAKNRAMREARITARLHHRNAVPVFDVVEHDGQPCLIMQFLPSVPLSAELREGGSLTVLDAARVGAQVASALAAAHALGIVHRDVKPGNILITDDGTALLSDFGISHALGDATLTSTGLVHGTPAYLAPEVARGASSSFASDVFSLGATLYTCLEGGPPFGTDPNSIALLYRVASGDFEPPRRAGALAPLLMEMLRADPDARPAMSEAADRLAAVEAGDHGPPPPPAAPAPSPSLVPAVGPTVAAPAAGSAAASVEATGTTQVRRTDEPAPTPAAPADASPTLVAAPASLAPSSFASASPASAPPASVPPSPPPSVTDPPPHRRRTGRVLALVALLVGLVVLGTAVVTGQFRGGSPVAGPSASGSTRGPATARASATGARTERSSEPSASPEPSESDTRSSSASSSASASSTGSPSSSPTPTATSGTPTAQELADAVTTYYGLVPDDTDRAWDLLTAAYQRSPSGGRSSYDAFWRQVQSVKISNVDATPPSRVDATLTYRRSGGTSVERTEFHLVRDGGVLKIAGSSFKGRG